MSVAEQSNRHRVCYDRLGREGYFPFIHLQPINDGSLLTVTRHLVGRLGMNTGLSDVPHEYLEQIAVGNFGKFSIDPARLGQRERRNLDYATAFDKLATSVEYIVADINAIRPDIVILPRTIFNIVNACIGWTNLLAGITSRVPIRFFKIFQTNARVINIHIARRLKGVPISDYGYSSIGPWLGHSKVKKLDWYLAWIDLMLEKHRGDIEERLD